MAGEIVKAFFIIIAILGAINLVIWILVKLTEAELLGAFIKGGMKLIVGFVVVVAVLATWLAWRGDQEAKARAVANQPLQAQCIQMVQSKASAYRSSHQLSWDQFLQVERTRKSAEDDCRLRFPTH